MPGFRKRNGEIRTEVKAEVKRQNRRSIFSPTSLSFLAWVILVVMWPYVAAWFGYSGFYTSIVFQGEVSLVVIAVTLIDLVGDAVKKR